MTMIMKKTKMMLVLGALLGALGCNDDVIQDLSSPTDTTKEKEVVQAFLAKNAPQAQHFTVDSDQPIEICNRREFDIQVREKRV